MSQVDRIIIRFEIVGGTQAQAILTSMNMALKGLAGTSVAAAKGVNIYATAMGTGATSTAIFNTTTSSAIFKISEFAVVIFAVVGAYRMLMGPIIDVNKNMKIVESVSHATAAELRSLQDEALRLGTIFPGGAKKATEALVAIGQAGYDTRQSLELMEPVFALATIGAVSFDESVQLVITTLNAFRRGTDQTAQTVDTLASSISHTLTTFETFGITMPMIAALAGDLGVSFEELVALIGWLTDRGIKASRVGTALKAVFSELTKETVNLSKKLEGTGLTTEQFDIKARGLQAVLEDVAEAELTTAQKLDLLGLRGIYALGIFGSVDEILEEMVGSLKEAGETTFQAGTIVTATASKWGQFVGTLQQGLVKTFQPLLKHLNWFLDRLKMLMRALGNISPGARKFWQYVIGIGLALAVLNVAMKATAILAGFLWGHIYKLGAGLSLAWKGMLLFASGTRTAAAGTTALTASVVAANTALKAFYVTTGNLIALAVVIGTLAWEWSQYANSQQGALDQTIDHTAALELQQSALKGVLGRMKDVEKKLKDIEKSEGNAAEAMLDFYDAIFEMIDIYPEFLMYSDTLLDIFSNMPSTIDAAGESIGYMTRQIKALGDEILEFEKTKFMIEFGLMPGGAMEAGRPPRLQTFHEFMSEPFTGGRHFKPGEPTGFMYKEFERRRDRRFWHPSDIAREYQRSLAGKDTIDPYSFGEFEEELFDVRIQELLPIIGFADAAIDGLDKRLAEGAITAKQYGDETGYIFDRMKALTKQARINEKLLRDLEDVAPPTAVDGDGKAPKYEVPGRREFMVWLARERAKAKREEEELATFNKLAQTDEIKAERQMLNLRREGLELEYAGYDAAILKLQTHIDTLTNVENIVKANATLNDYLTKRLGVGTRLVAIEGDLAVNYYKNVARNIDEWNEKIDEWKDKNQEALDLFNEMKESIGTIESIMGDLRQIAWLGELFGKGELDIANQKLREVQSQIERLVELQNDLILNTEKWVSVFGEKFRSALVWIIGVLLPKLIAHMEYLVDLIADLEAKEFAKRLRESTEQSLKGAITSALLSDDVESAIEVFANMLKRIAAEYLAEAIMQSMFAEWMVPPTTGEGDDKAAATGGAWMLGEATPWVGGALLLSSLFGGLFGGDKISKLETKLDYILRGAGYQLPSSFVLDEPGEFSWRRRGRDSFMIRFPKRALDVNITTRIEVDPKELMRITAEQISVGGMSGGRQFSYRGD